MMVGMGSTGRRATGRQENEQSVGGTPADEFAEPCGATSAGLSRMRLAE